MSEKRKKSSCPKPLGPKSLDIYLLNLYQVCSNYAPGDQKWPRPRGHLLYLDLYEGHPIKNETFFIV